ncbi:hypothetical protein ACWD3Z_00050 [Streptomyces sp. NPDC002740]
MVFAPKEIPPQPARCPCQVVSNTCEYGRHHECGYERWIAWHGTEEETVVGWGHDPYPHRGSFGLNHSDAMAYLADRRGRCNCSCRQPAPNRIHVRRSLLDRTPRRPQLLLTVRRCPRPGQRLNHTRNAMPNQLRVTKVLTENVVGPQIWNGRLGECQTMPTDQYAAVEGAMAAVLERVAAAIDWPRLLAEASWRHSTLHEETLDDDKRPAGQGTPWECHVTGVCGECLRHALLSPETGAHDWAKTPDVPLNRTDVDWAGVVAESLQYRRDLAR